MSPEPTFESLESRTLFTLPGLTGIDIGPMPGADPLPGDGILLDDGEWLITGGGNDIWNNADAFHFEYADVTGDFDAVVRVKSVVQTHQYAKASIMARAGLGTSAVFVHNAALPAAGSGYLQGRSSVGGAAFDQRPGQTQGPSPAPDGSAPVWLRLMRTGDTFHSSWATDLAGAPGEWWYPQRRHVPDLPDTIQVGLAVTSHDVAQVTQARFDGFHIGAFTSLPLGVVAPDLPGPAGGDGTFGLREVIANGTLSTLRDAINSLRSGTGIVLDYHAPTLNFSDTGPDGHARHDSVFGVVARGQRRPGNADDLALVAKAGFHVPSPGWHTFLVRSDDGFQLAIDGRVVGAFDGIRGSADSFLNVNLDAGLHSLQLTYHQAAGAADLELLVASGEKTHYDGTFRLVGDTRTISVGAIVGGWTVREARYNNGRAINDIHEAAELLDTTDPALVRRAEYGAQTINFSDARDPGSGGFFRDASARPFALDTPGDDNDFALRATGLLRITEPGAYSFGVRSDDGFRLRIHGAPFQSVSGEGHLDPDHPDTIQFPVGHIDTNTIGTVVLQPGDYPITLEYYERIGGAYVELAASPGIHLNWDATFTLLGGPPKPGGWALTAPRALSGDANLDNRINADDYFLIDSGFLAQPTSPTYRQGDFNYDGRINADDYFLIDSSFLAQRQPLASNTPMTAARSTVAAAILTDPVEPEQNAARKRPARSLFSDRPVGVLESSRRAGVARRL